MADGVDYSHIPTLDELYLLVPEESARLLHHVRLHGAPMLCASVGKAKCILSIDHAGGRDWFHVSVSLPGPALPSFQDLARVREALFKPEAVVVQVFPPASEWYTAAEVLHLWQRIGADRLVPDLRKQGAL